MHTTTHNNAVAVTDRVVAMEGAVWQAVGPETEETKMMPVAATAYADRIVHAVIELNAALAAAADEQRLFGVLLSANDLITAYLTVAALNNQFHWACEQGTLPLRPPCGTA